MGEDFVSVYLDNSATTKPCKEAVDAITDAITNSWANPSALYTFGIDTAYALRNARKAVADAMGAEQDRVYFTSGGTEADNWAIFSAAKRYGKKNKHIILKTDNKILFASALESLSSYWYIFDKVSMDLHNDERKIDNIMTDFEKQYFKEKRQIYYVDASFKN